MVDANNCLDLVESPLLLAAVVNGVGVVGIIYSLGPVSGGMLFIFLGLKRN